MTAALTSSIDKAYPSSSAAGATSSSRSGMVGGWRPRDASDDQRMLSRRSDSSESNVFPATGSAVPVCLGGRSGAVISSSPAFTSKQPAAGG